MAGEVLVPRRTPTEDESAFNGGIKGRRVRPSIVIVIDGECAEVVSTRGQIGYNVAILLAGGKREESEILLLWVMENEGLRDYSGGAAGVESVGEPSSAKWVGGVD